MPQNGAKSYKPFDFEQVVTSVPCHCAPNHADDAIPFDGSGTAPVDYNMTDPAGNARARIACGVIMK